MGRSTFLPRFIFGSLVLLGLIFLLLMLLWLGVMLFGGHL